MIVSLRHDFLDRVAESASGIAELVSRGTVLVGPLDRHGLRSALCAPAEALSHRLESEALVTGMLDALAGASSALPLLQFTAAKLWEGRDAERRLLTEASYLAFGGVGGALASHADSVLDALGSAERRCARTLLLRLVTPERTRAIVTRRELSELGGGAAADLDRALDRLIEARLVTVEGAGRDESTVELVHESLIGSWPALVRWIEEEQGDALFRERLRVAAKEWEASGGSEGLLWRGETAEEARRWRKRQGTEIGAREARYLAAMIALEDRERRRRRQLVIALFVALALVVLVVSRMAVEASRTAARAEAEKAEAQAQRAEAQTQRAEAERSAASARNASRMAAARERQADPTTALALLREIEPGSVPRGWGELARWARGAGVASAVLIHDDVVHSVAWSPDGRRVVSASNDKAVRVWNADGTGQPLFLRGHEAAVNAAAWSPDGRRVVSASKDKTLRVWSADGTGQPLVLRGHAEQRHLGGVEPRRAPPRLCFVRQDRARVERRRLRRAPRAPGTRRGRRGGGVEPRRPAHRLRVAGSDGARVERRRHRRDPRDARTRSGDRGGGVEPRRPANRLRRRQDRTLRVWSADGKGPAPRAPGTRRPPSSGVAWSPDGRRIASASDDKTVRVWNADGKGQPLIYRGHEVVVNAAAWSPDGRWIASASQDKTVRVWSAAIPAENLVLEGHDDQVESAAWSPDGRRIVSASVDKTVRVWSAGGQGPPLVLRGHADVVRSAAWSPDGRRIVSASEDKTVRVWSPDGRGAPLVLRGHDATVYSAAWSPDGRRIASASHDKTVSVWNADGSGEPLVLRGHDDRVMMASWSLDGRRIVSASWDKTVRVWNADGSDQPVVLRGHDDIVYSVAWSPTASASSPRRTTRRCAFGTPTARASPLVLRGHEDTAAVRGDRPVEPRRPAHRLGVGRRHGPRVERRRRGREPLVLRASRAVVNCATWSPDGRRIAVALEDHTVVVWSDLEPLSGTGDPKLWTATSYCMPVEVRTGGCLGFPEDQAKKDPERCQRARPAESPS